MVELAGGAEGAPALLQVVRAVGLFRADRVACGGVKPDEEAMLLSLTLVRGKNSSMRSRWEDSRWAFAEPNRGAVRERARAYQTLKCMS